MIGSSDDLLEGSKLSEDLKGSEFIGVKMSRKIIESNVKHSINSSMTDFEKV